MACGLYLFAPLAQAQYVQGGAVNAAPDTIYQYTGSWAASTSYTYTFAKPTTAPCTIILTIRQPAILIPGFTLLAGTSYGEAWQKTTCGSDTSVTVNCPAGPCWAQFTVSEYAGQWTLDQQSPEAVNVDSADGWTVPITPTQNGELIIGYGSNHTTDTPSIAAGTGFTIRAVGNEFVEDMLQTTAAPVESTVTYSESVEWCQTTLSFKLASATPPPPPPPHSATLSWTDETNPPGTTYNVYRSSQTNCPAANYTLLANVTGLTYVDTTIAVDATYCFKVTALFDAEESIEGVIQFVPGSVKTITVQ